MVGRLTDGIELRQCVGNRQHGLLHSRIEQVTAAQLDPRHQRAAVILHLGIGPADAKQRLVRERTFKAHALQRLLRGKRLPVLQQRIAEREVGLVAQRRQLFVERVHATELVENLLRRVDVAAAHHRDAEIELRVAGPFGPAFPVRQHGDGALVTSAVDQDLRLQHLCFALQVVGQVFAQLCQSLFGVLEIATLLPDLGEKKPGAVAHFLVDVVGQQPFENASRFEVVAVRQVHTAEQQLGLLEMLGQLALLLCRQKPHDRRKIIFLVEVEKDLAVLRVPYDDRLRIVLRGQRRGHCGEPQHTENDRNETPVEQRSLPFLDYKLRLLLFHPVGDFKLDVLGADTLVEPERRTAAVVARMRTNADESGDQLMLAGLQVSHVHAVHAAAHQRVHFAFSVQVVGDFLDRIKIEVFANIHRDEERNL